MASKDASDLFKTAGLASATLGTSNLAWRRDLKTELRAAYDAELGLADAAETGRDLARAFAHLERAHILGQRYFTTHMYTHMRMLRIARLRNDGREVRGQLARMVAVFPGYLFDWVPKGNTGGANVSPVKPMPLPDDLAPLLRDFVVWRDVVRRLAIAAALAVLVALVWPTAGKASTFALHLHGETPASDILSYELVR